MASHILVIGETLVDLVPGSNGREAIEAVRALAVAAGFGAAGASLL